MDYMFCFNFEPCVDIWLIIYTRFTFLCSQFPPQYTRSVTENILLKEIFSQKTDGFLGSRKYGAFVRIPQILIIV